MVAEEIGRGNEIILSKFGQGNELRKLIKRSGGWLDEWMGGLRAVLRIGYSNQQSSFIHLLYI